MPTFPKKEIPVSFADAMQEEAKSQIEEYDESSRSDYNNDGEINTQKYSSEEVSQYGLPENFAMTS